MTVTHYPVKKQHLPTPKTSIKSKNQKEGTVTLVGVYSGVKIWSKRGPILSDLYTF